MITTNLFEEVLIKPVNEGADKLLVVSGYATYTMVSRHFEQIIKAKKSLKLQLIVGMCKQDGLSLSNHLGFQKLTEIDFAGKFECSYIHKSPAVHSKLYIWLKNDQPVKSFTGSANYTQNAFGKQREILTQCDNASSLKYFEEISTESIYCNHIDVESYIPIYSDKQYYRRFIKETEKDIEVKPKPSFYQAEEFPCISVSFLDKNGDLPDGASGLNWGFRPDIKRNLNQAYIQLRPEIYKNDFFPPKGDHFTVNTDDGKRLVCKRATKKYGDAILTPNDNSQLGEYFRNRLGLAYGAKVSKEDLEKYGRTDITFCKIDDETYEMDFSVGDE
jgi:NgoFVII restriction endonuclease